MACHGTAPDHCCYVDGEPCPHLRDDGTAADRRWVCTLREELGDWTLVHADPRYLVVPAPHWRELGVPDCGDWEGPCSTCGLNEAD